MIGLLLNFENRRNDEHQEKGYVFGGLILIWQGNLRCKSSTSVANPSSSAAIPERDFRYRVEWHNSVMHVTRAPLSMRRVITYSARTEAAAARRRPESASERTNDANYYSCLHVLRSQWRRKQQRHNKQTISVEYKERATLDKQRHQVDEQVSVTCWLLNTCLIPWSPSSPTKLTLTPVIGTHQKRVFTEILGSFVSAHVSKLSEHSGSGASPRGADVLQYLSATLNEWTPVIIWQGFFLISQRTRIPLSL